MTRTSWRASVYRFGVKNCVEPWLVPLIAGSQRATVGKEEWKSLEISRPSAAFARVWIHAASVGELESLWPIVETLATSYPCEFVLTVLSASARQRVDALARKIAESGKSRVLVHGYSPWEGSWKDAIERVAPSLFVTAKYEAWPELWVALAAKKIPLMIFGARARRSLTICKRICLLLGSDLPKMTLATNLDEESAALRESFPNAAVVTTGEPRWDRVFERAAQGNPRARELQQRAAAAPRPWGVLGSAWTEDLRVWFDVFKKQVALRSSETFWIVPHKIDEAHLRPIEDLLKEAGVTPVRTSIWNGELSSKPTCLVVDEMGFLSELYAQADWAYVGGGFGDGVHSTIEPAIHGIPIASGTNGAAKFSEISELARTGQLSLVSGSDDIGVWYSGARDTALETIKKWKDQAQSRCGASRRAAGLILAELSAPGSHATL